MATKYTRFPRWKAGVLFAVILWLLIAVEVLIIHPINRFESIVEGAVYAVMGGVLYIVFSWFMGEKMKSVKVEVSEEKTSEEK